MRSFQNVLKAYFVIQDFGDLHIYQLLLKRPIQGGKSGSRDRGIVCIPVSPTDPLYPCIANGSSVSCVSPMDPVYRR